jgi:hypothetical protein
MDTGKRSLRSQVDKWFALAATQVSPLRVTRIGRTAKGVRYVCVEVARPADPLTIAFFYHEDGNWCVFPPATGRYERRTA